MELEYRYGVRSRRRGTAQHSTAQIIYIYSTHFMRRYCVQAGVAYVDCGLWITEAGLREDGEHGCGCGCASASVTGVTKYIERDITKMIQRRYIRDTLLHVK